MKNTERPIFIVGVHRSGTTLLRYMLNSHPHIYIPPEFDFIPRFFLRHPTRNLTPSQVHHMLEIIFTRYRFIREWDGVAPKPGYFLTHLPAQTPAAFLDKLYRDYAAQKGAQRWGDKTPIYSSYLPLLDKIFPTAQFIHLYRDGRDVAVSMLEKWGAHDFHIDIYFTARNWDRRTRQAPRRGQRWGTVVISICVTRRWLQNLNATYRRYVIFSMKHTSQRWPGRTAWPNQRSNLVAFTIQ